MALFSWTRTGFGRTWSIDIGTGTSADLYVKQWPVLEFVKRPTKKEAGVYPRKLTIPIVDYNSSNGYLRNAVFDSELECTLSLNSSPIFSGVIYQSDIIKNVGEDQYDTEFIVSDGLQRLSSSAEFSGTYTYEAFLKELLWETGFELPIHFYTDWEEDNASAGLVDTHRLTYSGDNYMEVLQNFCKDFGYQVYQENNVWVVRSLAYFAGASVTRYVITSVGTTSSVVNIAETVTGLYKSSDEDIIRGTGTFYVNEKWEKFDETFVNLSFEDGFNGWDYSPTIDIAGELDVDGEFMSQLTGKIHKTYDRINFDVRADIYNSATSGDENAKWLQIIATGINGNKYYLESDGTWTQTEAFIEDLITFPPTVGVATSVFFQDDIRMVGNGLPGFSANDAFKVEIKLTYNNPNGNFQKFVYGGNFIEFEENTTQRTIRRSSAVGTSTGIGDININAVENNRFFIEDKVEYYNGSVWKPALLWYTLPFGQKRAKDEVIVRNQDMEVIRADMDYGTYKGLDKIYADATKEFIPLTSKITIGLDDVEVMFVRHERSAGTITLNDEFTNDN